MSKFTHITTDRYCPFCGDELSEWECPTHGWINEKRWKGIQRWIGEEE